jgi:hypothetical protein
LVEQRTLNPLADSSSLSWPTTNDSNHFDGTTLTENEGEKVAVCRSVCTPLEEATFDAAIASVTRALAATDDPAIAAELVGERRALREELRALRETSAVGHLADERARRR